MYNVYLDSERNSLHKYDDVHDLYFRKQENEAMKAFKKMLIKMSLCYNKLISYD